jgi:uncharacterized protein (TIGR01244 family)
MKNEAKIGRITVAGQPTEEELRGLRARGFGTIINNRLAEELPEPESAKVELGVTYVEIPFTGSTLSREHIEETRAVLARAPGEVLMH